MTEELERLAAELDDLSMRDVTRSTLIAGSAALPAIGGLVSILIDQYMPEQRAQRLVRFVRLLKERLEQLADRIDRDFVRTEEFEGLAEEVLESAGRRRSEAKQSHYAWATAISATTLRPDEDERFRMLDTLDRVRESHLRLLLAFTRNAYTRLATFETLGQRIADETATPMDAVRRDWDDLASLHLVGVRPPERGTVGPASLEGPSAEISSYGRRFLQFVGLAPLPDPDAQPELLVVRGPESKRVVIQFPKTVDQRRHITALAALVSGAAELEGLEASLSEYGSANGLGSVERLASRSTEQPALPDEVLFRFRGLEG